MTVGYDLTSVRLRPPPKRGRALGEWDWFFALSFGDQQACRRHMVKLGMGPDDLADMLGTDIDAACERWRLAIRGERLGAEISDDDLFDNYDLVAETERTDLVGPGEVATMLGVKLATVHQWRKRRLMPDVVAVLTSTPIWRRADVETWARDTGRL